MADVISLPRPTDLRPARAEFGFFVRVGRNDHREMLDLIASGECGIFGFVFKAQYVKRHHELILESRRRGFDVILDPETQQMGFPGSHNEHLAELPWGSARHHRVSDFDGAEGRAKAQKLVEFALENRFTQILGPTHLLTGANDPWLRRDIQMMHWLAKENEAARGHLGLIYSLGLPMEALRNSAERQALVSAVSDAPHDALWLKIENFGDTASGEKTAAYIEACRDFHNHGVPIIGDHVGGLPALGALAFGAVGGIAHGVTLQQGFQAAPWRRPPTSRSGGPAWRVYLKPLDLLVKPAVAESFLSISPRIRGRYGCRDTHCCPHGIRDMTRHPARHALYQRARELETLAAVPERLRIATYLDDNVRPVSDSVAAAAALSGLELNFQKCLVKKQKAVSRFRQTMVHLAEVSPSQSVAIPPRRRASSD